MRGKYVSKCDAIHALSINRRICIAQFTRPEECYALHHSRRECILQIIPHIRGMRSMKICAHYSNQFVCWSKLNVYSHFERCPKRPVNLSDRCDHTSTYSSHKHIVASPRPLFNGRWARQRKMCIIKFGSTYMAASKIHLLKHHRRLRLTSDKWFSVNDHQPHHVRGVGYVLCWIKFCWID